MRDMFSDLVDFLIEVMLPGAIFTAVVGVAGAGAIYLLNSASCTAKSDVLGLSHSFGFFEGCFVEVNGEQLPLETYLERKVEQNVAVRVK